MVFHTTVMLIPQPAPAPQDVAVGILFCSGISYKHYVIPRTNCRWSTYSRLTPSWDAGCSFASKFGNFVYVSCRSSWTNTWNCGTWRSSSPCSLVSKLHCHIFHYLNLRAYRATAPYHFPVLQDFEVHECMRKWQK